MMFSSITQCLLFSVLLLNSTLVVAQDVHSNLLYFTNQQSLTLAPNQTYTFGRKSNKDIFVTQVPDFSQYKYSEFLVALNQVNTLKSIEDGEAGNSIFGMYLQAGYGKLKYNYEGNPLYEFDYTFTKGGGVSLEIPLLKLSDRFSIYNELGFSQFNASTSQHNGDTVGGDPENNYYDVTLTFAPNIITISNIVKYKLTPGEFNYYVALGIYNSFVVSSTNLKETVHVSNGETDEFTEQAVPDPSVYGLMMLACTGFSYRNFGLEFRFDPGRSFSNKLNYAVYMPNFMAVLHVTFNKK
jgi:hypothetical protein